MNSKKDPHLSSDMSLEVCGGCNAKMGLASLSKVLKNLTIEESKDPNLLLSFHESDDAAIYRISETEAIVQTLDFFPPPVKDPYLFGQIAACNALSDIYAMGASPITALNIVAWPERENPEILQAILQGGQDMVSKSGASLCGGHSIHDPRVKYGLAVTGKCLITNIKKNNTAQDGDMLILTKPLGIGLLSGKLLTLGLDENIKSKLFQTMTTLNSTASEIAVKYGCTAMTDVTGFSLIGHLREMLDDRLNAKIYTRNLPILDGALEASRDFLITAGGIRNRDFLRKYCVFRHERPDIEAILFDPQTSGGLLFTLPATLAESATEELKSLSIEASIIGEVYARNEHSERSNSHEEEKRIFVY